ncbi:unnamed protein product, partial [Pylaiella littoralis]
AAVGAAEEGVAVSEKEKEWTRKLEVLLDGMGSGGGGRGLAKEGGTVLARTTSVDGRRKVGWGRGGGAGTTIFGGASEAQASASGQSDDQAPSSPPRGGVRAISDTVGSVGRVGGSSAERARWKEAGFLSGSSSRARRSLSIGGLKGKSAMKGGRETQGWLSDGEEAEGLSPIGHEARCIAYMKQRRSSANKGDKSTGGLGSRGAWPNKSKKDADSAQVIYLGDIDFDAPGKATATDILVRQHRTRVRVKRVKDKGTARKKRRTRPNRRIRSGKPLHPEEDEVEYILTIGMMLGLRVAVGRQENPLVKQELMVEDFYQVDKYTFPPSGATGYLVTPSHKLGRTFKFKDYAPKVFKKIREHFGVDKVCIFFLYVSVLHEYMGRDSHVCVRLFVHGWKEVGNNCLFLVRFISFVFRNAVHAFSRRQLQFLGVHLERQVRGVLLLLPRRALHDQDHEGDHLFLFFPPCGKSSETKFLRRILPHYYEHVKVHPETFLVRFYGMYRVKMHHLNKKVHFIVMNSVLDTYKEIHNTYDLKGSSLGRDAKPGEKVLKDNDLADRQGKLHLGSQREAFLKVARADSEFLARMKIMDYSLLTGIHDRAKPAEEEQPQSPRRYSRFFTFADEADNKTTPGFKPAPVALPIADAKAAEIGEGGSGGDGGGGGTTDATAAATTAPAAEGEGDCPKASPGSESPGRQGGTGKGGPEEEGGGKEQHDGGPKLSPPGVVSRAVEAPSSAASGRTFDSNQAELMFDNAAGGRISLDARRKQRSAALKSVTEAAAAGELYPFSAEEESYGIDMYSDEEVGGGGTWSGAGTGTEGEGDATDTGGDYTEGDVEYETPGENESRSEGQDLKRSLSRCSTVKGNLSQLPDPFLSSQEASAVVAAAAAAAAAAAVRGRGRGGGRDGGGGSGSGRGSGATGRVWMGRTKKAVAKPRPEPRLAPPESRGSCVIKRRSDGGLDSEVGGKRGRDIYFMGIIDILQASKRKHGETFFKSLAHDRSEISCVDPATYCQRFNDFLERHTD